MDYELGPKPRQGNEKQERKQEHVEHGKGGSRGGTANSHRELSRAPVFNGSGSKGLNGSGRPGSALGR